MSKRSTNVVKKRLLELEEKFPERKDRKDSSAKEMEISYSKFIFKISLL